MFYSTNNFVWRILYLEDIKVNTAHTDTHDMTVFKVSSIRNIIMELVNKDEIKSVVKQFGLAKLLKWHFEEFQEKVIGYLGDHLKLIVEVEVSGVKKTLRFFVKCMPRNGDWITNYLKESKFFKREYVMLSSLFPQFVDHDGVQKWRPKLFYTRDDLFIFEDLGQLGYAMPHHRYTMSNEDLKVTIQALARFHAASYIFEENKSAELGRPYRIWEDYSEYLQEPEPYDWRNTGRNAIIDFLKASKYISATEILTKAELVIPMLFEGALHLLKPSSEYRNVVVHRDLWTNNIMIKRGQEPHAMIVDFQTVVYSSPMLDLTSLIYFNTTRTNRDEYTDKYIDIYYSYLSFVLKTSNINVEDIMPKDKLIKSYNDSIMFGITQAALIVPIIAMSSEKREEIFCDPKKCHKVNVVSRSEEFIQIAKEDANYRNRVSELFGEIIDRYIIVS